MRPAFALIRQTALQTRAHQLRCVARPRLADVGCSHWAAAAVPIRLYSAKPKPPKPPPVEIAEETLGAEFFEEVEVDADPEWEGEEVSEGVFMSAMPETTVPPPKDGGGAEAVPKEKKGPRTKHTIKHLNRLLSRHQVPDLDESELEEKFVRGRGPGGQAINKTNSSVSLLHKPTGIRIQSQPTRSRAQNRVIARQILKERLDLMRARGELEGIEPSQPVEDPANMSRKERLAAEARTWSKQELRWEKERRRKQNRRKKVNKRKNKEGKDAEGGGDGAEE